MYPNPPTPTHPPTHTQNVVIAVLLDEFIECITEEKEAARKKILAEADISIFYLSTYENDYTLVSQADIARAAEAFESAGFRLERSHR